MLYGFQTITLHQNKKPLNVVANRITYYISSDGEGYYYSTVFFDNNNYIHVEETVKEIEGKLKELLK